jgi:hypothetical protein
MKSTRIYSKRHHKPAAQLRELKHENFLEPGRMNTFQHAMTSLCGRCYFVGLRVTKRNKATVLLALTLFQTPTLSNPNLTLLQVCF